MSGSYHLRAVVDRSNAITEADEGNNSLAGNQITVNTDIIVTAVSGPVTGSPGSSIGDASTVENLGGPTLGFSVGLFLSTDATITTGDIYLGSRWVNALAGGAASSATTSVTLPAGLPPGRYYLGAIADRFDGVAESNEGNNSLAGPTLTSP